MAKRHPRQGAPHTLHSLMEVRALAEMALLPLGWPMLSATPNGDGHPALLLPGFMADEIALVAIKAF